MEFGKVSNEELAHVSFRLPPDPATTKATLAGAGKPAKPVVYVGCAKWGRKEWVGEIYPKGTKDAAFLDQYVRQFNSIELNATHYQIYGSDTIGKWAEKAGDRNFLFCPKVPQVISHFSNLATPDAQRRTDDFLRGILAFGRHLGPVFLQLSERYAPASRQSLFTYLRSLPRDLLFFVELRHPEWFANKDIRKEWLDVLGECGMGTVITDASGRRDCVHMELTIPKAFIRFVGNGLVPSDYTRIDAWVKRIGSWLDKGLNELYFFMHQHDERYSPRLCDYVIEKMNRHCGTSLQRIHFLNDAALF